MNVTDLEIGKYYCYSTKTKQARLQFSKYETRNNRNYLGPTSCGYTAVYVFLFIEYLWRDANIVRRRSRKCWQLESSEVASYIFEESEFINDITKL